MKATSRASGFLLAAAVALSPVRAALAQGASSNRSLTKAEGEAEIRFKRGVELYRDSDFAPALIEFRRAYELAPNYRILYNIGQVQYQLQDYAGALRALQKYLTDGGSEIAKERRTAVETEIEKLKLRVGSVEVTIAVEGAEIAVDDVVAGKSPLPEPLLVSAGRRKITASRDGRVVTKIVEVGGGDVVQVSLELPEAPLPPGLKPDMPTQRPLDAGEPQPRKSSLVWLPWTATGALAAGAVVTGVMAFTTSNEFKQMTPTAGNQDERKRLQGKAVALGIVTDVLAGAAVVLTGVSIYVTVAAGKSSAPAQPGALLPAKLAITAGPSSVSVVGTF